MRKRNPQSTPPCKPNPGTPPKAQEKLTLQKTQRNASPPNSELPGNGALKITIDHHP
jgi:hypothetical protein